MSSATERPSRAPSTTKSVMRAMAPGWLGLTPRSSRRRATTAAMAIKSLSFSRGVRFMGPRPSYFSSPANFAPLSGPQPWLASAQRDNGRDKAHAQLVERRGEKEIGPRQPRRDPPWRVDPIIQPTQRPPEARRKGSLCLARTRDRTEALEAKIAPEAKAFVYIRSTLSPALHIGKIGLRLSRLSTVSPRATSSTR